MSYIYTSESLKKWDAFTVAQENITSLELMERAATSCCKKILSCYIFETVHIVAGPGNNGGDGLVMARVFNQLGLQVNLTICNSDKSTTPDFDTNLNRLPKNVTVNYLSESSEFQIDSDLIIDCLFGSGLNRPITGWLAYVVKAINDNPSTVVSIDMPSGLHVTNNLAFEEAAIVLADRTLTFEVPKMPFFFSEYSPFVGKWSLININLSTAYTGDFIAKYIERKDLQLGQYSNFAFKGTKGYLTLIGSTEKMLGATLLAAKAAFKTGCGYVGVIADTDIEIPLSITLPESIYIGSEVKQLPAKSKAIAIGPGLGKSENAKALLNLALESSSPIVVDADALNLLADDFSLIQKLPQNSILTPHLGELHRLIGLANSPEELLEKQLAFSIKHAVFIIQKGAYSKLTTPLGEIFINSSGNSAMATAGMGDALTGMIGSFLAQGYAPKEAALNGMYFHGAAGDEAARQNGELGLLTSDVIAKIPFALNKL